MYKHSPILYFLLLIFPLLLQAQITGHINSTQLINTFFSQLKGVSLNNQIPLGCNLSFHTNHVSNSGHHNLDNNAELYVPGSSAHLLSARFEYSTERPGYRGYPATSVSG